ncbi:MAG TPA: glycoside hydrolase family 43 protein [Lachnospiraceae bacterium]|nr:glycoside hydrolase family 43 protein [Lachnospiraceae bacterium]
MRIQNPIIPGFHPDPSIIRVNDTYYIANSTFEWFPGVSIHQSKNLKDWELLTYPLATAQMLDLRGVLNGGGVWAPCLSYRDGTYYLVFSIVRTDEERMLDVDNYLTTAGHIKGPWTMPVCLNSGGFDASLFHDEEDHTAWLVQMKWDFQPGNNLFRGIFMQKYDDMHKKLVGKSICIFKGTDRGFTEGPHLYRHGAYYYLMTAEGGTRDGHCITMARSLKREGPYETDPENPILSSAQQPAWPIQYAGHGDLFEDGHGNWYLVHLGVRRDLAAGYSVMGRETFLQQCHWTKDHWFRPDTGRLPQETVEVRTVCEEHPIAETFYRTYTFDSPCLDIHFSTLRIPLKEDCLSLKDRPGYLRLKGRESIFSKHHQVMAALRLSEISFQAETEFEFEPENFQQTAGLTFFYNTANFYYCFISRETAVGKHLQVMLRDNNQMRYLLEDPIRLSEGPIRIRAEFCPAGIQFFYSQGTDTTKAVINEKAEQLPIKILSDEYATESGEQGFTGTFLGLCCQDLTGSRKPADFKYLKVSRLDP